MTTSKETIFSSIILLYLQRKVFIKCPNCGKALGMFEVCNANCSFCGKIDYDKMFIVQGFEQEIEL